MDESTYNIVTRHTEAALKLQPAEQREYLDQLQQDSPSIAGAVMQILKADVAADAAGFLGMDPRFTPTSILTSDAADQNERAASRLPASIAGYDVIEKLGEGGMGTVYRVFQKDADREVALKVLHPGLITDHAQLARFRNEAKSAASLQHDHIVPVYDVGDADGVPYFTMAVVEGSSLEARLRQQSIQPGEAAALLKVLAHAIQYANGRGIVHRDLKPGNVLIDDTGKPWITDFGIAKRLNDDIGQTRTGQIVGTAAYMSPEQIDQQELVGQRSDVYGLGAILYHCLTGRPPFDGPDVVQVLSEVRLRMPQSPRNESGVNGDLASICMKCLQKSPDDRYGSASELAEDLDRFLRGDPIGDTKSSWTGALGRVLSFRLRSSDFLSAGAARATLLVIVPMHLVIFYLIAANRENYWLWLVLACGTVAHGIVSYRYHWSQFWQLQVIERQSGIVQLSVSLAFVSLFLLNGPLTPGAPIDQFLQVYPPLTIVVGVATFAHGGYSGRWLLSGALCFPASLLINSCSDYGPLVLSAVSALILMQADSELRGVLLADSGVK